VNANDPGFRARIGRIESLIDAVEQLPDPAAQTLAREIVQRLLEFHGAALANLVGVVVAAGPPGHAILDSIAHDELAGYLLLLHGLHPDDLEARVAQALDRVRPQLQAHGGSVELLGVADRVVRLRMQGSCQGCPSSAATLRQTIEAAVFDAAPDVASLDVEGLAAPASLSSLPIITLEPAPAGANGRSDHGS